MWGRWISPKQFATEEDGEDAIEIAIASEHMIGITNIFSNFRESK